MATSAELRERLKMMEMATRYGEAMGSNDPTVKAARQTNLEKARADLAAAEANDKNIKSENAGTAPQKPIITPQNTVSQDQGGPTGSTVAPIASRNVDAQTEQALNNVVGSIQQSGNVAQNMIQSGTLGRLDATQVKSGTSDMMSSILQKRKEALSGLSDQEINVAQEKQNQDINRSTQTMQRQLQAGQNASGTRGGTASTQQLQVLMQGMQAKANVGRDLFLQNQQAKREALNNYEASVTGAESTQFQKQAAQIELQKFNLAQAAKEQGAQLNLAMGLTGMSLTSVAGDKANAASLQAAQAGGGGGKKIICTELFHQGIMPVGMYLLDQQFGDKLPPHIMDGYQCWAKYVVKLMKKSKLFTKMVSVPALCWGRSMAGDSNLVGNIIMCVGLKLCSTIGKIRLLLRIV